jgi:catalase
MMSLTVRTQYTVSGAVIMALAILEGFDYAARAVEHPAKIFEKFEKPPKGETQQIDKTAKLTTKLQDMRKASQDGKLLRGVHPKSHGCVRAQFVVRSDIQAKYRVGLFAQPGKVHGAWIRFSNASVLREHDLKDGKNGSRGMAIKVMDVEGDMLIKDNGRSNQDFLMINTPEFAFANVRDYHRLTRVLIADKAGASPDQFFVPFKLFKLGILGSTGELKPPADNEPEEVTKLRKIFKHSDVFKRFSPKDLAGTLQSIQIVGKIQTIPVRNPLQVQYFGAAPFLFGKDRAMKFSAAPCKGTNQAAFVEITADNPPKDYLRDALSQTMKGEQNVCYDFKIQVRSADAKELNIENATTTWPDEDTSYINVAKISIAAQQAPHTDEAREHCEKLAFSPWHSLADHQPIGGINRLRLKVYSGSAKHRGAGGY